MVDKEDKKNKDMGRSQGWCMMVWISLLLADVEKSL